MIVRFPNEPGADKVDSDNKQSSCSARELLIIVSQTLVIIEHVKVFSQSSGRTRMKLLIDFYPPYLHVRLR